MSNREKFGEELNTTTFGIVDGNCGYNRMTWLKAEYKEQ